MCAYAVYMNVGALCARRLKVDPQRTLVVGDRIDTGALQRLCLDCVRASDPPSAHSDILFGSQNGVASLLVMTGARCSPGSSALRAWLSTRRSDVVS